jgi:ADP-ribose pyrophosphatase
MPRQIVFTGRKIQAGLDTITGRDGQPVHRDVVLHPGAVAILPLLDPEHLILVRNQRFVVGAELLEIPAGTLEPPEPPEQAAPRELAEETGYRAGRWRKLSEFYPSPGVLSERTHLFLAQDLTPGAMQLDEGEELHPEIVSWDDALRWALDGTIRDAKTMIALLLWARLRHEPGERGA